MGKNGFDPVDMVKARQQLVDHFIRTGWPEDASLEVSDLILHAAEGAISHIIRTAAAASNQIIHLQTITLAMELVRQRCEVGLEISKKGFEIIREREQS